MATIDYGLVRAAEKYNLQLRSFDGCARVADGIEVGSLKRVKCEIYRQITTLILRIKIYLLYFSRAIIGNCHFSAGIYDQAEKLSLSCLLDDSRLYLSKRPPKQVQFAGESKSRRHHAPAPKSIDVKVGEIGFLHANVEYTLPDVASEALPTWNFKMKNDLITVSIWDFFETLLNICNF